MCCASYGQQQSQAKTGEKEREACQSVDKSINTIDRLIDRCMDRMVDLFNGRAAFYKCKPEGNPPT